MPEEQQSPYTQRLVERRQKQETFPGLTVPGGETGESPYTKALRQGKARQRLAIATALDGNRDPVVESRVKRVGLQTGLPDEIVRLNLDNLEKRLEVGSINIDALMKAQPELARWMLQNDPTPIRDDVANLSGLGWLMKAPIAAMRVGAAQAVANLLEAGKVHGVPGADHPFAEEVKTQIDMWMLRRYFGEEGWFEEGIVEFSKFIPQMAGASASAGVAAAGAAVAGQLGPQVGLPEELITVPGAARAGAFAWSYLQGAGEVSRELSKMRDEDGNPLDPELIRSMSVVGGAGIGALEVMGMGAMARVFPGGKQMMTKIGAKKLAKKLTTDRGFRMALTNFGKDYFRGATTETGTEVAQQLVQIMARHAARKIQGGEWEKETLRENFEEMWDVGLATMKAMSVGGGFLGAGTVYTDVQSARRAGETYSRVTAMTDLVGSMDAMERTPESVREIVGEMKKAKGAVQNAYINFEKWNEMTGELGVDPVQTLNDIMGEGSYETLARDGGQGDIVLPIETYLERIARTELNDHLTPHIRFAQEDISLADKEAADAEAAKDLDEVITEAVDPKLELDPELEEVHRREQRAVLEILGDPVAADTIGKVVALMSHRRAQKVGMGTLDHYEQYEVGYTDSADLAAREAAGGGLETIRGRAIERVLDGSRRTLTPRERQAAKVVRGVARREPWALKQAAQDMAAQVEPGAVLVPVPDRSGSTDANRELAEMVAKQTGSSVLDALIAEAPAETEGFDVAEVPVRLQGEEGTLQEGERRGDRRQTERRRDRGDEQAADEDRQGTEEAPSYPAETSEGQLPGAVQVRGFHFSQSSRAFLDGRLYGRGLQSRGEHQRLSVPGVDPRILSRVYFYVDTGQGIHPEFGVGRHAHDVMLNNVYDVSSGLIEHTGDDNAFEVAVVDAGYSGYLVPFGRRQSAVVLLGDQHTGVPVRQLGTERLDRRAEERERRQTGERRQQFRRRDAFSKMVETEEVLGDAEINRLRAAVFGKEATPESLVFEDFLREEEEAAKRPALKDRDNVVLIDGMRESGARIAAAQELLPKSKYMAYAQGEMRLSQSVNLRRGKENIRRWGLDPETRPTVREVGIALEKRQRQLYGKIDRSDRSEAAEQKIARWIAAEVRWALAHPQDSGAGWYSEKFPAALDVLGGTFAELKSESAFTDASLPGLRILGNVDNARNLITALIAISSAGNNVETNWKVALAAYDEFRRTGAISADRVFPGKAGGVVSANVQRLLGMMHQLGPEKLHEYLLETTTVAEFMKAERQAGRKPSSAYPADMTIPRSGVLFGPKIGAFYANMMGAEGYLTMDLWWSRSFNRYRGTLVPQAAQKSVDNLKAILGDAAMDDDTFWIEVERLHVEAKRKKWKKLTKAQKAGARIWQDQNERLQDEPFNPSDRGFMVRTILRAHRNLKRSGIDITVADLQAVLWYYEKRLYGELGARKSADISYEEVARSVVAEHRSDGHARRQPLPKSGTVVDQGPDGVEFETVPGDDVEYLDQEAEEEGLHRLNQVEQNPDNPAVMFRSVSAGEAVDIQKTGKVSGRGNFFSGDVRRLVFFGEDQHDVIHHGEDLRRFVEANPDQELQALFDEDDALRKEANDLRREFNALQVKVEEGKANLAERRRFHRMGPSVRTSEAASSRVNNKVVTEISKRVKELRKKQKGANAATSFVMEFDPTAKGTRFTGRDSLVEGVEIGFESGVVTLDTLRTVHVVQNGKVVGTMTPEKFAKAKLDGNVNDMPMRVVRGQGTPGGVTPVYERGDFLDIARSVESVIEPNIGRILDSSHVFSPTFARVAEMMVRLLKVANESRNFDTAGWGEARPIVEAIHKAVYDPDIGEIISGELDNRGMTYTDLDHMVQPLHEVLSDLPTLNQGQKAMIYSLGSFTSYDIGSARDWVDLLMEAVKDQKEWKRFIHQGLSGVAEATATQAELDFASMQDNPKLKRFMKGSEVVEPDGSPRVLYHETYVGNVPSIERRGFFVRPSRDPITVFRASSTDYQMPDGVFMKSHAREIGVGGGQRSSQIPLVVSMKSPLRVRNREELTTHMISSSPAYAESTQAVERLERSTDRTLQEINNEMAEEGARIESDSGISPPYQRGDPRIARLEELDGTYRAEVARAESKLISLASKARAVLTRELKRMGHDGIIVEKDEGSGGRFTDTYISFKATNVKHATKNLGTFDKRKLSILQQPMRGRGRRGEIAFFKGGRKFDISMFEGRDPSTFLHEQAHVHLEIVRQLATEPNPGAEILSDQAVIFEFLGMKSWSDLTEAREEMFADAFEQYFREGVAPTEELQPIFAKIKAWLVDVYKEVRELIKLSPEMRGMFDRMLASEQQIEMAQREMGLQPVPGMAEDLDPTARAEYVEARRAAREEATDKLRGKLMASPHEIKAWFEDERTRIRQEVEQDFERSPRMKALKFLQKGSLLGHEDVPSALLAMPRPGDDKPIPLKLSKQAILDRYGPETLKKLPRHEYVYAADSKRTNDRRAADPDDLAPALGFKNGAALIEALVSLEGRGYKEHLEEAVQRRIESDFTDIMQSPSRMAQAALDAATGDRAIEQLVLEVRWLQRKIRRDAPQNRAQPFEQAEFTAKAQEAVEVMQLHELKPHTYRNNAKRHGTAAFNAAKEEKLSKAFDQKLLQLWNLAMEREVRKAREEADRALRLFRRMQKGPAQSRLGRAGEAYQDQVNDLLAKFELRSASGKAISRRESLQRFVAERLAEGEDILIDHERLAALAKQHYRQLQVAEMRTVKNAVENIYKVATLKTKLSDRQADRDFEQGIGELLGSAHDNIKTTGKWDTDAGKRRRKSTALARLDALLLRPEEWISRLDGRDPNGPWARMVFEPFAVAQKREVELQEKYTLKVKEAFDNLSPERRKALFHEDVHLQTVDRTISREAALVVALNWGNLSNRSKLVRGGIGWGALEPEVVEEILSSLQREDWALVRDVWSTLQSLWPEIEAMEKEVNGVSPKQVEPMPFTREFEDGTSISLPGGYFPVVFDERSRSGRMQREAGETAQALFDQRYTRAMTPHGHTIERHESYTDTIETSIDAIPRHLNQAIHDLTHRQALLQANRILSDQRVVDTIYDRMGKPVHDQMLAWIKYIANQRNDGDRTVERFLRETRMNLTVVAMGLKATTSLQNFANFFNVLEPGIGLRMKYLMIGMRKFITNYSASRDLTHELSLEMRQRFVNLDRDLRDAAEKGLGIKVGPLSGTERVRKFARDFALASIRITDMSVAYPAWLGKFYEGTDAGLGEHDAARAADAMVTQTLTAGAPKDLAAIQRGGELMKGLTMFYSWFGTVYMRQRALGFDIAQTDWTKDREALTRLPFFLARIFAFWLVPSMFAEVLSGRGPGRDDDDETVAEWMAWTTAMYPAMSIPVVRDAAKHIDAIQSGQPVFPTQYHAASRVLDDSVRALAVIFDEGSDALFDERDFDQKRMGKAVADLLGNTFGLPAGQFKITAGYVYDLWAGDEEPESTAELIMNLLYRKPRRKEKR